MEKMSLKSLNPFGAVGLAVPALLLCGSIAPAAVMGLLSTGSSGTVIVSLTAINFTNDPSAKPLPGPPWNSDVATNTNLQFAGCATGVLNSAGCLITAEGIHIDSPITASSVGDPNFLTFESHANLVFNLLAIAAGSANTNCAAAVNNGDSCSVFAGSPIILTKTATGTAVSIALSGRASDTGAGGLATGSLYNGGFSETLVANLPNGLAPTPGNIQRYYCPSGTCTAADFTANRTLESSQSGSFFATAVPEPGTWSMFIFGSGLLAVGLRSRRKQS